jgi:hypothetical protein
VICQEWTELGAYALGALDPAERRRVDEHVRGCPVCAAELAELEALPPLLDRVRPEDLEVAPVPPSPDLYERVAAAADAHGARRTGVRWLLAAAAAVLLAAVGGVTAVAIWASRGAEPTYTASAGDVRLTVTATAQEDGTALDVTVNGLPPGTECELVAIDAEGNRHDAGWWKADYDGEAMYRGWTEVDRRALEDVLLTDAEGDVLVRIPVGTS